MDLFSDISEEIKADSNRNASENIPLAEKMRPHSLSEMIGQTHLLGEGMALNLAFLHQNLHSMIFWGPPGVGKTTIARLIADAFKCQFIALSAVFSGLKEVKIAIEQATHWQKNNQRTVLFIDEIHRFNKAQQDILLPFMESGLITFIGATTENPSFELNRALLSRSQVYVLQTLSTEELQILLQRAQTKYYPHLQIEAKVFPLIAEYADGDGRRSLNLFEQLTQYAKTSKTANVLSLPMAKAQLKQALHCFDKNGEYFYDQISALHKSVRGSNPNAAIYWFVRMIDGGVDPLYLARRLMRMAWEDIGLADPRALQIVNDAFTTFERLGSPEGELALAAAIIYLACAPKSNSAYNAYNQAKAFVAQDKTREVPIHLRNAPTKLMKELGYGKTYRYAHDEPFAYAAGEHYFPEDLPEQNFYQPTSFGLEKQISERLKFLKELDGKINQK